MLVRTAESIGETGDESRELFEPEIFSVVLVMGIEDAGDLLLDSLGLF